MIPLIEKIRISSRLMIDVVEVNNIQKVSATNLSQNQFLLLKILYTTGSKTVSEIASILGVSKPAASKIIDYLVIKKFISRKAVAGDRRSLKISIIYRGKKLIEKYNEFIDLRIKQVMNYFSKEEKNLLDLLLDKYILYSIEQEQNLHLFCLQCGGKYEGKCPVGEHKKECYFQIYDKEDKTTLNTD